MLFNFNSHLLILFNFCIITTGQLAAGSLQTQTYFWSSLFCGEWCRDCQDRKFVCVLRLVAGSWRGSHIR